MTRSQITNLAANRVKAATDLYTGLTADQEMIATHNADKNRPQVDPAPYDAAVAASQALLNQLVAHINTAANMPAAAPKASVP